MTLPAPYFQDDAVTIYCADCRDILPDLPKVDLVLTDPPYGIGYCGGGGGNLIHSKGTRKSETVHGDDSPFDPKLILGLGNVAMFGAQHYYTGLPEGGTFHVWDKRGDYDPVHTADFDTIWINRKEVGRIFRSVWRGLCRESEYHDRILHPTQKPLRVVSWVMGMFPDARLILDPFAGSGTTGRAAKDLGRRAILIEIEERYCEIAAKRMAQGVLL